MFFLFLIIFLKSRILPSLFTDQKQQNRTRYFVREGYMLIIVKFFIVYPKGKSWRLDILFEVIFI